MANSYTLKLPAVLANLERFIEFISNCALRSGMDTKRTAEIKIATEEALVNIIQHAYKGQKGDIEMKCDIANGILIIRIVDHGIPFNMLDLEDPDIKARLEERKVGGLGVFFIKKLMDKVDYTREGDKNILILTASKDHTVESDS